VRDALPRTGGLQRVQPVGAVGRLERGDEGARALVALDQALVAQELQRGPDGAPGSCRAALQRELVGERPSS
jgi:hypothetical protein